MKTQINTITSCTLKHGGDATCWHLAESLSSIFEDFIFGDHLSVKVLIFQGFVIIN